MTAPSAPTPRLSGADVPDECEIVVVGSGFGASVAAARLAPHTPPGDLVVLERGVECVPGEFPHDFAEVRAALRTRRNPTGLFDLSLGSDMDTLVACGLGGGSLIYANVLLEPHPSVFDDGWPRGLDADELAPWFDRVRQMLEPEVVLDADDVAANAVELVPGSLRGSAFERDLASGAALTQRRDARGRRAAERPRFAKAAGLGPLAEARGLRAAKVPVAINLTRPDGPNAHGVTQPRCTACGNCMTGCNVGAKTTMWASYLPVAHAAGAALVTGADVSTVAPSPRHDRRWVVAGVRVERRGRRLVKERFEVHCDLVVLGAGALGTTGILLRSRADGLACSPALGRRFSGNGDALAVSYNGAGRQTGIGARDPHDPDFETGPTITTAVDRRSEAGGHLVQDGVIPHGIAEALRRVLGARFALQRDEKVWCDLRGNGCPPGCGALEHSQVWLAMGADGSGGEVTLDRAGRPRIAWSDSGRHEVFGEQARDLAELSHERGALTVSNPRHALLGGGRASATPITVHPLGGAVLADSPDDGACDPHGRLYDAVGGVHPGLYVADGALCPTATGANPSLTIAALAERCIDHLVRNDLARLREKR